MKRNINIFLLFIFPYLLFGQSSAETKVRHKAKFNSDWKFILDDKSGFESPVFNDSTWRSLDLPHDWSIEGKFDAKNPAGGQGAYLPCGIGWYRKSFVIPDSLKTKRVVIQFDGVYMNSKVYINGHFLCQYPYGYSTFQYDLTEYLQFENPNVIAVRVDNSLQPSSRWYSGSGIYRNVWLIATNPVHFDNYSGVFVSFPEVSKENANVKVQYKIAANAFPETDFHGNEIPNQRTPDGVQIAKRLQEICHNEDPTRPVTSACDFVDDANSLVKIKLQSAGLKPAEYSIQTGL